MRVLLQGIAREGATPWVGGWIEDKGTAWRRWLARRLRINRL